MADITATLAGQVTITGELTVPRGIVPRGEIEVTENGNYDVTNYETADVAVPQPSGSVTITENGQHGVTDYVTADVQVPQPSGSIEITENGTVNVTEFVQAVVDVPTGATNVVVGNFTTPATAGSMSVDIPYSGAGYPICGVVFVKGGMRDNESASGSAWYSEVNQYAIGLYCFCKNKMALQPTYAYNHESSQSTYVEVYKNSNSVSYAYGQKSGTAQTFYTANASASNSVVFNSPSLMKVYAKAQTSTNFGFRTNQEYQYILLYSE